MKMRRGELLRQRFDTKTLLSKIEYLNPSSMVDCSGRYFMEVDKAMDTGPELGTRVKAADEKFCESCGAIIKQRAVICPKCGVSQRAPEAPKSKIAAGILGILLGGIGVHKFYLGKIGMGILYIVFCWTGIPSIIGLVEGIIYLTTSDEKWAQRFER